MQAQINSELNAKKSRILHKVHSKLIMKKIQQQKKAKVH